MAAAAPRRNEAGAEFPPSDPKSGRTGGLGEGLKAAATTPVRAGPARAEGRLPPGPRRSPACRGASLPGTRTPAVPAQRSERGPVPRNHTRSGAERWSPPGGSGTAVSRPSLTPRPPQPPDTASPAPLSPAPCPAATLERKSGRRLRNGLGHSRAGRPPPSFLAGSHCKLPPFRGGPCRFTPGLSFLQSQTRTPPGPVTEALSKQLKPKDSVGSHRREVRGGTCPPATKTEPGSRTPETDLSCTHVSSRLCMGPGLKVSSRWCAAWTM